MQLRVISSEYSWRNGRLWIDLTIADDTYFIYFGHTQPIGPLQNRLLYITHKEVFFSFLGFEIFPFFIHGFHKELIIPI